MKKRIEWIDNARGVCLLFVMAHHTAMAPVWMVKAYLPVFLTLFFFISGFLFVNPGKDTRLKQKVLNIGTSLLLPYFIYCSVTAVSHLLLGGYEAFLDDLRISVLGVKSWFISALVVTEVVGLLTLVLKRYRIVLCVCFMLVSVAVYVSLPYGEYFWNFRNAMFANVYFALGMLCRYYNVAQLFVRDKIGVIAMVLYVSLVAVDVVWDVNFGNFNEMFTNYSFFVVESLAGIPAFVWLCSKIRRYNKLIMFIGSNSLLYYYLQSVTIRCTLAVFNQFGLLELGIIDMLLVLLVVSLCIAVPVILINKYLPVMSGKYRIVLK